MFNWMAAGFVVALELFIASVIWAVKLLCEDEEKKAVAILIVDAGIIAIVSGLMMGV